MSDRASQQHRLRLLINGAIGSLIDDPDNTGCVVSGGLDSSTVECFAGDLPTFTGWYADPTRYSRREAAPLYSPYDEREWAHLVKGTEHHDILIQPQDFIDNFDAMIAAVRPPFQGMGTFGQYMVGKYIAANTNVKVVLSGEGADELFGGYARLMAVAGHPLPDGYENYVIPEGYPRDIRAALDYDYERLPLLLAVDDRCMAAHGLEARAPFTDPAIVDFALALPPEDRVAKTYLRETVRGFVPDAIIDRTDKRGFPSPLVAWAQGPCRDFIGDRLGYIPDAEKPFARDWWIELCTIASGGEPLARAA